MGTRVNRTTTGPTAIVPTTEAVPRKDDEYLAEVSITTPNGDINITLDTERDVLKLVGFLVSINAKRKKVCPTCGERFEVRPNRKVYCSIECRNRRGKATRRQ